MKSKPVNSAVIWALWLAFLATGITGLFADAFGVERSLFHRYSAYILVASAVCHLYLNRRALFSRLALTRRTVLRRHLPKAPSPVRTEGVKWSRRTFLFLVASAWGGFFLGRWLPLGKPPPLQDGDDLGELYHQWSKPGYLALLRRPLQWGLPPPGFKEYPQVTRVALPRDWSYGGLTVAEAIQRRRSIRDYSSQPLSLGKVSQLLYAAGGLTEPRRNFRAAPSAGALYPIEIYAIPFNVQGLAPGVYHYQVREHALTLVKPGDFRLALFRYCVGQDLVLGAGMLIVLTGIFQRTRWKYQERHYRYVFLEAGHIGQNIYLAATSLGLGACAIGAFLDDDINRLLGVDGKKEAVLYLLAVGPPAG